MSEINLEWFRHVEDTLRNGFCSPNVGCSVNTCACAISEDGADAIASLRSRVAELEKALSDAADELDPIPRAAARAVLAKSQGDRNASQGSQAVVEPKP